MTVALRPLEHEELELARELLEAACAFDDADAVAEEKLFGAGANGEPPTTLVATEGGALLGVVVSAGKWLRLLAVTPHRRRAGIGSALLAAAESEIARSHSRARTLDQPGNYLSPGIDVRNTETLAWLERRGYQRVGENCNLLLSVTDNPRVTQQALHGAVRECSDAGYVVRRIEPGELERISAHIAGEFSPGWGFEVGKAARFAPAGVHLAVHRDSGELASFAAHDGNNAGLGWFGPTGTWPAHRGKGLARALLLACLLDVATEGHQHCQVAWIGPRDFYDKVAGIAGERRFIVLDKEILRS